MPSSLPTLLRRASLPALCVTLPLLLSWLYARFVYASPKFWPTLAPKILLGFIALLFLLTTAASILWTAFAPSTAPAMAPRPRTAPPPSSVPSSASAAFLGYALLVDSAAILLLLIALSTGLLTFLETSRIYLLLVTWVGLWTALTFLLRRFSAPLALLISLTLSSLLFASPITADPLAHASSHWTNPAHEKTIDVIAYATPLLPAFHAVKTSLSEATTWDTWPLIYRHSGISQELALRAQWPLASLLYASATLPLLALLFLTRRKP